MSLHDSDIAARLKRFLDRRALPRRLEGKPAACEDEIRALSAALARNAPRSPDALAGWWPLFETILGEASPSLWPTEKEVRDAAQAASKNRPVAVRAEDAVDMSDEAINARRMQRGEPVGEGWLWGRNAVAMIARGLIDRETMQSYRSGAFLARKALYGEAAALAWEADAKDRHEVAREVHRLSAKQAQAAE
jgi:hypothetical protein